MRKVTLRIRPSQTEKMMRAVSRWLEAHGVMPAIFHYDTRDDEMLVVRMDFARDDEANAFAGAFCKATVRPQRK